MKGQGSRHHGRAGTRAGDARGVWVCGRRGGVSVSATLPERLRPALHALGMRLCGGFHPTSEHAEWAAAGRAPPGTVIVIGNAGSAIWPVFNASAEHGDGAPHAMDRWTRRVLSTLAQAHGVEAVFPFDPPPYWPFQRWAMRAEPVAPSPVGMLIHPEFGLWHAYRGAFIVAERIALPPAAPQASPCDACAEKPCLSTCPVHAFSAEGYDVAACRAHVRGAGAAQCGGHGCAARRACPVGATYRYAPAHAAFHMRAFAPEV